MYTSHAAIQIETTSKFQILFAGSCVFIYAANRLMSVDPVSRANCCETDLSSTPSLQRLHDLGATKRKAPMKNMSMSVYMRHSAGAATRSLIPPYGRRLMLQPAQAPGGGTNCQGRAERLRSNTNPESFGRATASKHPSRPAPFARASWTS